VALPAIFVVKDARQMPDTNGTRTHEPSLRELTAELDGAEQVLSEKISGLEKLAGERDRRYEDRFKAMDEKTSLALNASEKAVTKAEVAQEKRFDNTNEWRAAMQDRDRNQMPRVEIEQRFGAMKAQQNWTIGIFVTLLSIVGALIVALLKH
jgi:hypothetical protein